MKRPATADIGKPVLGNSLNSKSSQGSELVIPSLVTGGATCRRVGRFGNVLVNTITHPEHTVRKTFLMTGPRSEVPGASRNTEKDACIGGMRNPLKALSKVPINNVSHCVRQTI